MSEMSCTPISAMQQQPVNAAGANPRGVQNPGFQVSRPDSAVKVKFEEKAKNLPKGELKRKDVTYALLADKLASMGISETERNLNNKISRGEFTAAFFIQCLEAIGTRSLQLLDG